MPRSRQRPVQRDDPAGHVAVIAEGGLSLRAHRTTAEAPRPPRPPPRETARQGALHDASSVTKRQLAGEATECSVRRRPEPAPCPARSALRPAGSRRLGARQPERAPRGWHLRQVTPAGQSSLPDAIVWPHRTDGLAIGRRQQQRRRRARRRRGGHRGARPRAPDAGIGRVPGPAGPSPNTRSTPAAGWTGPPAVRPPPRDRCASRPRRARRRRTDHDAHPDAPPGAPEPDAATAPAPPQPRAHAPRPRGTQAAVRRRGPAHRGGHLRAPGARPRPSAASTASGAAGGCSSTHSTTPRFPSPSCSKATPRSAPATTTRRTTGRAPFRFSTTSPTLATPCLRW